MCCKLYVGEHHAIYCSDYIPKKEDTKMRNQHEAAWKMVEQYAVEYEAQGFTADKAIGDNREAFLWLRDQLTAKDATIAAEHELYLTAHRDNMALVLRVAELKKELAELQVLRSYNNDWKVRAEAAEARAEKMLRLPKCEGCDEGYTCNRCFAINAALTTPAPPQGGA